ncbi:uncharacterized protein I206_104922 [Kwoniella pini CBS 10737]|uniref:Mus7/MMS22 family-domain-containing protein n=1 Tax=Kwoniella pini CBS 10737 TaxID=1296096 RepID=A0A1B9I888_9TREE|nr:uncharacterized protein I206_02463 [Kwoniella pini CBS 10737]OCF51747.1 hypothetical protein I206_02463 [Kwoniella pini CBS 10737]
MPPRAGPSNGPARKKKAIPTFIPSTQFANTSSPRSPREESEDPLALSPIKVTPIVKNRTRRGTRSSNARQSSPVQLYSDLPSSTQRVTRGSKRRDREVEELDEDDEDLVPPSEDDEYEVWREARRIRLNQVEEKGTGRGFEAERRGMDVGKIEDKRMKRPKKPDKTIQERTFESLLPTPSPPSHSPSISSSMSDTRSRNTSPTQPLSYSQQDDPFYILHEGQQYTPYLAIEAGNQHDEMELLNKVQAQQKLPAEVGNTMSDSDKSRSPTPQTMLLLPLQDQAFETLAPAPSNVKIPPTSSQMNSGISPAQNTSQDIAELLSSPYRSPTPQTIPFLPLGDQGFETMLSEAGFSAVEDSEATRPTAMQFLMPPHMSLPPQQDEEFDTRSPIAMMDVEESVAKTLSPHAPFDGDITITLSPGRNEMLLSPPKHPEPIQQSSPARSLSQMFAAVAETNDSHAFAMPNLPTPPPIDPLLQQFRGARTFRTRTVLQLQPYTKEKQIYEAALRKGGLKKGKKAIAPSREITQEEDHDDEAQVSESSEASAAEESPERIVIGDTPPLKKTREPKKLVDTDFDEFFFEHGTAADEDNSDHVESLQKIARKRLKAAKEEKKRLKEAEKERERFESLMRDMRGEQDSSENEAHDKIQDDARPFIAKKRSAVRTPNGVKTYGNRTKLNRVAVLSPPDAADNALPSITHSMLSPSKSQGNTPTASFRTAFSGFNDIDMDVGYGQPQDESFLMEDESVQRQTPSLARENSFFINDLARSPSPSRLRSNSDSDSSTNSGIVQDRRKKIAGRMMPAAMLKRLEAEAAAKERQRQEKKSRRQAVTESPIRPGRAVKRRGGGHGGLEDIDALFEDDDPENVSSHTPSISYNRSPPNSFDQPIVVSDGDSSSEAEEDNQTEHTLARLHRGDFESIVSGVRWKQNTAKRKDRKFRVKSRSDHGRPALGLAKRVRAPISETNRAMLQSRLDFPVMDKSPITSTKKTRKRPFHQGRQQRPAIRLDDHVIFTAADFEFDDVEESPRPVLKQKTIPRQFARTTSANLNQTKSLDTDMGKARSWANFDKFSIDFDITPLPSGLYCNSASIPGTGQLARLVKDLQGLDCDTDLAACFDYGIELRQDMTPSAIQAVVPLLFDAAFRQMMTILNEDEAESLPLGCFIFLGRYITVHQRDLVETTLPMVSDVQTSIRQLNLKLEGIDIGRNKQGRNSLLEFRWAMLELSCRVQSKRKITEDSLVRLCAVKLFRQLLSYGFDRTIRPLKQIMRGESESAEISDITVTMWISMITTLNAWDNAKTESTENTFMICLNEAFDSIFEHDRSGPIAAERIWFLVFGLCALSQFNMNGKIDSLFITTPRWLLVRRAVGLIKVAFDEDAEKRAQLDQLRGRDRYIKVMMARCVRLSAIWKWSFDRESFSVATRDLGIIFKDRQYRNLPTEPPVDYPDFITRFDMSLTAAADTKRETAFELYLRLVCVAASDIISSAQTLTEAQQAEKDVQRLVMSIIPVSAVKFNRLFPPSPKDLGQLINRYSTMIAGCYFSPSLLSYLLANSKSWSSFESADFDSRQIAIRGLMYLCVATRHHNQPLKPIINRLNELMKILQGELEYLVGPSASVNQSLNNGPTKMEIERTMVLIVSCFKQMIKYHSFAVEEQEKAVYPDPSLLHESWTVRIFDLELSKDLKCGLQVIATIQSFLDTRASALPKLAKQRREAKESHNESFDEFGSLGIDFTDADVLALGGELGEEDQEVEQKDVEFAAIIENVISPKIYRLLSDMLPPVPDDEAGKRDKDMDRQPFISRLTKCWSDCAAVLVVEHQKLDWSTFISPFGRQSWARLGDEKGRVQVGLHFMLNVAQLDLGAFVYHEEDFVALFFQVIGTDRLTVEHHYTSALLAMRGSLEHPLLAPLRNIEAFERELSRDGFMGIRGEALRAIFETIPDLLRSSRTAASIKSFTYKCINLFVSSLISYEKQIDSNKIIHKESYRAFTDTIIRDLRRIAGDFITPLSVPGLKHFKI